MADMTAFDQLPSFVRALLSNAEHNVDAQSVLRLYQHHLRDLSLTPRQVVASTARGVLALLAGAAAASKAEHVY